MKDFEKWIKQQIKHYSILLGVQLNDITLERKEGEDEYMSITCTYPYIDPIIYYSESAYKNWKKGNLKRDRILHELCHILTDPLYYVSLDRFVSKNTLNNERERLTDTIASIISNLDDN
jgi:hypothetical protein